MGVHHELKHNPKSKRNTSKKRSLTQIKPKAYIQFKILPDINEPKLSKILVAIDGSEESMHAADYAIVMAIKYDAELIAIHVVSAKLLGFEYTPQPQLFGLPATPSSVDNIVEMSKREAEHWLDGIKQQLFYHRPNKEVKLRTEVIIAVKPSIVGEIVDYAQQENVDLVVVGTRGRSGFKKLLLGSVALGVVTYSHCPVMVTK
jgi:nucleotide-binding universal stress UspA family protein